MSYRSPIGGPVAPGVLARFLVLDQDHVEAVPSSLDAASLPIAALTAWHAVAVRSQVGRDDSVLVHGTGGVAMFALRFATALGARVAVTTSSSAKAVRLAELGADHVIDHRGSDVADEVLRWTEGRGVDHVVETVGGANLNQSLRAVRIGGSIAFIGLLAGLSAPINTYELVTKNVELHGIETGSAEMYRDMVRFIDAHSIKPVIDSIAPLADVKDALRRLESGDHFGKVVLVAGSRAAAAVSTTGLDAAGTVRGGRAHDGCPVAQGTPTRLAHLNAARPARPLGVERVTLVGHSPPRLTPQPEPDGVSSPRGPGAGAEPADAAEPTPRPTTGTRRRTRGTCARR